MESHFEQSVLNLARSEARNFGSPYVGTEHLLIALVLRCQHESLFQVFRLSPHRVLDEVTRLPMAPSHADPEHLPLSMSAKSAINHAIEFARATGRAEFNGYDLLCGILSAESVASQILANLEVTLSGINDVQSRLDNGTMWRTLRSKLKRPDMMSFALPYCSDPEIATLVQEARGANLEKEQWLETHEFEKAAEAVGKRDALLEKLRNLCALKRSREPAAGEEFRR